MTVVARGQLTVTFVDDGIGITSVDVYYYLSTSSTTQAGGSWSTTAPVWVDGKYMWSKTRVTYTDATYKESLPVCITGGKGSTGKGVAGIVTEYYLSTSKTTQTGGSWSTTPPTVTTGKYVWTRTKITWSDATITYTTPVCDSRINDLETSVETVVTKQASIDTALADITLQASETIEKLYHYSAGSGNIYDNCVVSVSKDTSVKTEVSLSTMPLLINKDVMRGRDIVISVDIYARNAIPKSLSGYMGVYFTITYTDNTTKKYMCAYYPGVRYLQQQLSQGSTSMYQRIYTACMIDDKAIKSVSNLTITIACNGESLKVSNPKVEIGTEPINGELGIMERMRKAEIKITPEAITQAVSEQIGDGGELKTAKFTLDVNGGHFSGGGIDISNNSGEKVLFADTNGNLTARNLTLTEGNISGNSQIKINTELYVGDNIYLGDQSNFTDYKYLYFDKNMYIKRARVGNAGGSLGLNNDMDFGMTYIRYGVARVECSSNGVGITSSSNGNNLQITNSGIYSTCPISVSSDERKKHFIKDIDCTEIIDNLRVVSFKYLNSDTKQLGVIAQEILSNEYADYIVTEDDQGYYAVNYNAIGMALVQKVQQQQKELDNMKLRIEKLELLIGKER